MILTLYYFQKTLLTALGTFCLEHIWNSHIKLLKREAVVCSYFKKQVFFIKRETESHWNYVPAEVVSLYDIY